MRIDTHSHLFPRWYLDYFEDQAGHPHTIYLDSKRFLEFGAWRKPELEVMYDIERKLALMDAAGVDMSVLSLDLPGPELLHQNGSVVARRVNEWLADLCRRYPERFVGLASLPLQSVPDAIAELDYCWTQLDLRGALLFSNIAGTSLDEPRFDPFFAYAASAGIPLYLHPAHPLTAEYMTSTQLVRGMGFVVDTSLAVLRLIFAGTFARHPDLQLIMPHTGGLLPSLIERLDFMSAGAPGPAAPAPSTFVRRLIIDTVASGPMAQNAAFAYWALENILFGTDHPYQSIAPQVQLIENSALDSAARQQVFSGNAKRVFRIR